MHIFSTHECMLDFVTIEQEVENTMSANPKGKTNKSRGEETREKLIQVGLKLFALNGYNGVSMRNIASVAEVNLATVGYHFGGKLGLYEAVLRSLIERRNFVFPSMETAAPKLEQLKAGKIKKSELLSWFYREIILGMLGTEHTVYATLLINRELVAPSELYPLLDKEFFNHSIKVLELVLGAVMDESTSREEAMIVGISLIGMALKLVHPKVMKDRIGWDGYNAERIEFVTEILCRRAVAFVGCQEA